MNSNNTKLNKSALIEANFTKSLIRRLPIALGSFLLVGALPWAANAGEYQFDLDTRALSTELNGGQGADQELETYGATATIYFKPVDDSKGPFSQAAFLSRASSVAISSLRTEGDFRQQSVDLTGVFWNRMIVAAEYTDVKSLPEPELQLGILVPNRNDNESYSLGVGVYITGQQTLTASYRRVEVANTNNDDEEYNLAYKWLYDDPDKGMRGIDAAVSYGEDIFSWQLGFDFFPTNQFSVGGGVFGENGSSNDEQGFVFGVDYFFTSRFHLGLQTSRVNFDQGNEFDNIQSHSVNLGLRL